MCKSGKDVAVLTVYGGPFVNRKTQPWTVKSANSVAEINVFQVQRPTR